jgi:hypothetical protein
MIGGGICAAIGVVGLIAFALLYSDRQYLEIRNMDYWVLIASAGWIAVGLLIMIAAS